MCYWNEADGKHKLFAYNVGCYQNGTYSPGQFDGLTFYRYNNATKQMTPCGDVGFEVAYGIKQVKNKISSSGTDVSLQNK